MSVLQGGGGSRGGEDKDADHQSQCQSVGSLVKSRSNAHHRSKAPVSVRAVVVGACVGSVNILIYLDVNMCRCECVNM